MRTRIIVSLVVALAGLVGGEVGSARAGGKSDATPRGGIGVGSAFVVEPPASAAVRELDARERREQVRDWAVIAAVQQLGATPEQVAAATHELPAVRLPYSNA
jgi:hypothetical protein